MSRYVEFPKIARLSREIIITEKIDGTNASIVIVSKPASGSDWSINPPDLVYDPNYVIAEKDGYVMLAGSRTKFVKPGEDNHGFAAWVVSNADQLFGLGPGQHFGEWWGSGIQRGYNLPKGEKRFSLFNTSRWGEHRDMFKFPGEKPECCHVVPVLGKGPFDTVIIDGVLAGLRAAGSVAAPGFLRPEGIVIYHTAANLFFKKTIEKDEEPKSKAAK